MSKHGTVDTSVCGPYNHRMVREIFGLEIHSLDSRGRGVAHHEGRRIRVTGALPGETVDVRIRRKKAGDLHAEPIAVIASDRTRREPFCRHFGTCGGCSIQDLEYSEQLRLKDEIVTAAYHEFYPDAIDEGPRLPILPAPTERRYRNKLEFSFGARRWLSQDELDSETVIHDRRGFGFHVGGRFDRVLDIQECFLQADPSEDIRRFVADWTRHRSVTFYDSHEHRGHLRLLIVRTSLSGETMVIVMFGEDLPAERTEILDAIQAAFPSITSLNYVINTTRNDSIYPHDVVTYAGTEVIHETCGDITLRLRPKAFYQTNPEQAVRLYTVAAELADLRPHELVYDLYSGIGSIALFIARRVARVVGIESVGDAVRSARENAALNAIENVVFEEGEVEAVLPDVIARQGTPDLLVIDPPRAGMHPKAIAAIRREAPRRIVYVSCNPRTQARDCADLADLYRITAMQPVDMFPQTRHIENICVLHRLDSEIAQA